MVSHGAETERDSFPLHPSKAPCPADARAGQAILGMGHQDARAGVPSDERRRVFYFFRRWGSQLVKIKIDGVDAMTVDDARKVAEKYNADCAAGHDPRQARRDARREEPTFGQLFDAWWQTHGRLLRSAKQQQRLYDCYLAGWSKRRLGKISKDDVKALHRRLGEERGHVQANRVLSLIRMTFGATEEKSIGWTGPCPAAGGEHGVKKFKEHPRDRYLQADELPRFFKALAAEPNPFLQGFFVLCLATACRRGTIQRMRWDELDLLCPSGPSWRCPLTKNGEPQNVSLTPVAVDVLDQAPPLVLRERIRLSGATAGKERRPIPERPHARMAKTMHAGRSKKRDDPRSPQVVRIVGRDLRRLARHHRRCPWTFTPQQPNRDLREIVRGRQADCARHFHECHARGRWRCQAARGQRVRRVKFRRTGRGGPMTPFENLPPRLRRRLQRAATTCGPRLPSVSAPDSPLLLLFCDSSELTPEQTADQILSGRRRNCRR